jgi:superfamily II DNA or RNA helicase
MHHDIIDNREFKLIDELARRFPSSEKAKFAVGYFFLSGLEPLHDHLYNLQELRLLIGNTTNRETIEQISEGYRRLEPVQDAIEADAYPKRSEIKARVAATVTNVRESIELMEQTDQSQQLIATLTRLIAEKRLQVRVYNKGRLHAKAYIFDYTQMYDVAGRVLPRNEPGVAIVGSSNFSLSGISHNTELNIVVHGRENHERLTQWFEELWQEGDNFDQALMEELQRSWAVAESTPYDIYMKTLYTLVRDRLEETQRDTFLWNDDITAQLAEFQRVAVRQAIQTIMRYNGCFVSDVVGLGKSYIGAAIVKHFERVERARPLIICPKPLLSMWERYNEVYQLNAHVLAMSMLRDDEDGLNLLMSDVRYKDRDFVLIDESHNFRNPDSQRYRVLQQYLEQGRRCVLLTATPRTRDAWDIYHQLRLFHPGDVTNLPIDPPNLRQYFTDVERGQRSLPALLANILIRRTRSHILRWYGYDATTGERLVPEQLELYRTNQRQAYVEVGGRKQTFPNRELQTVEYSIEETYIGLYDRLRLMMGGARNDDAVVGELPTLRYARYGLWQYVLKSKQRQQPYSELQRAGTNLRGLIRSMLFKRFESSVFAFTETLRRMLTTHRAFLAALDSGIVPAGEEATAILHDADAYDNLALIDTLRTISQRYPAADFNIALLRTHIAHDIAVLEEMLALVQPITPERDAKLTQLRALLDNHANDRNVLLFTQYADTARYLFSQLNPERRDPSIEVIYSNNRDKARIVARFSPSSNREILLRPSDSPIHLLIATDVLSEGLNLQDCDTVVNYDLHWNPVRLIQRFGRIDRIGTEYKTIYGINFLPERALERNLGLYEVLRRRIREIHETIGEDTAVLEPGEALNEQAMYAIYSGDQSIDLEEEQDDGMIGLNEAEELLRQLRTDDPDEYERIVQLRNGIRSGRGSPTKGRMVFCQAGQYQQLLLVDESGSVLSRDIAQILKILRCTKDEPTIPLDARHNSVVSQTKGVFAHEAAQRRIEQQHTVSLTNAQRYILRELRAQYALTSDEDLKAQVNLLEQTFRRSLTRTLASEINDIKRAALTGLLLVQELSRLFTRYHLDQQRSQTQREDEVAWPYIVCSEMFV